MMFTAKEISTNSQMTSYDGLQHLNTPVLINQQ